MKLLNIDSLRPGPSGNPKVPNAANVDESKASPYKNLPDPLITKNGEKVTSVKVWWNKRRAENVEDFDREVYGRTPKKTPSVKWELLSTKKDTVGKIPIVVLVREGAVIPHIKLAQLTAQMDWSTLELSVYSKISNKVDGLICLPSDQVLHKISLSKKNGTFALDNDPFGGKVDWKIRQ